MPNVKKETDIVVKVVTEYTIEAKPKYGYHASITIVTFKNETTEQQQSDAMDLLRQLKVAQGWDMWVREPKRTGPVTWTIEHGYDSGD